MLGFPSDRIFVILERISSALPLKKEGKRDSLQNDKEDVQFSG